MVNALVKVVEFVDNKIDNLKSVISKGENKDNKSDQVLMKKLMPDGIISHLTGIVF